MCEKENINIDACKHQLKRWTTMAYQHLPPTINDRDDVDAIEQMIHSDHEALQKQCDRLEEFVNEVIDALGSTDGDDIRAHLDEPLKELRGNYNG